MSKTSYHKSSSPYPEWNVKKFEEKLEKEVNHRRNLISFSTTNFENNNNETPKVSSFQLDEENTGELLNSSGIYKQFLLIGIPPSVENAQDPNAKSTVLIAYPPFQYPNLPVKKIIEHCMPTGQNREFLARNTHSPIQDEFVFQFGGGFGSDDKPTYGVCVHVSTKDTSLPFYGSKKDKDRIFCFCLMTRMPVFSVHFSFLTCLALWTVGHIRHLHKYDNLIRVNLPPGEPIEDLDLVDQIGHHPSITVPVSFQNEIASYFISKVTNKPEKLSRASNTFMKGYVERKVEKMNNKHHNFNYDSDDCSIELKFPPEKDINENSICWASLDTLFSLLHPSDILTIISGLLLDRQVLIIGSRLQEVSMVVWALQSIIRPFKFAGTIIPVLPTISEDYLGLLQLPTPFLFGVPRCNELKSVTFLETAVFVDLDKQNVPPVEELPPYPNAKYVDSELKNFLKLVKNNREVNEYSFPSIYLKTLHHEYSFATSSCSKICDLISSPFQSTLFGNYICGFFVTDMSASPEGVTVFNEELFLSQIHSMLSDNPAELYGQEATQTKEREKEKEKRLKEEIEFWDDIVESQTFQVYIEERMQDFMELKFRTLLNSNKQSSSNNNNNVNDEDESTNKNGNESASEASEADDIVKKKQAEEIKDSYKSKTKAKTNNTTNKDINSKKSKNKVDQTNSKSSKPSKSGNGKPATPKSTPAKVSINKNRKVQINNPKRIKSLKNVLFDLPTPNQSNLDLLNMDKIKEDRFKSDGDVEEDSDENMPLSSQKMTKSSTVAIVKTPMFSEDSTNETDDEIEARKKPVKRKYHSRKVNDLEDDEESSDEEVVDDAKTKNLQKQKGGKNDKLKPKSSLRRIVDEEDSSDSERASKNKNIKKKKSSSTADKSDNENDNDNKKRRSSLNAEKSDKNYIKKRKISLNDDDEFISKDQRRRKSYSNDKNDDEDDTDLDRVQQRRKSAVNIQKIDNRDDTNIDHAQRRRKSASNVEKIEQNLMKKRKSSSTADKSDSEEGRNRNLPKRRKSSSTADKSDNDNGKGKTAPKRKSSSTADKSDNDNENEPKRRKSSSNADRDDSDNENTKTKSKAKRKSNENKSERSKRPQKQTRENSDDEDETKKQKNKKKPVQKNIDDKKSKSTRSPKSDPVKKTLTNKNQKETKDDGKKKKYQMHFDSSSDGDSYSGSSDSINPNVFYKNEQFDVSSSNDEN